ncbi:fasciclin domain-containing protein [Mucilaginibacter celer]|nr:fasciclin domain-containing protein [Mucilaginibacter celer]
MNKSINQMKHTGLVFCLLLCTLLSACKYDDLSVKKPNETFRLGGDFLKNNYDFSLFYTALQYSGLVDKLNEAGPYTIIAPNNKAFNEIGIQLPGDIYKLNRDSLKQAMAYHIIPRKLTLASFPVNGVDVRYETLAGISLYESIGSFFPGNAAAINQLYFSGSLVYRKDVVLANGTLQAVDKVMKQYPGKTVQSWLASRPNFSIYVSGLKKFGLWDELAGAGPFTIFAPDNQAFINVGMTQEIVDQLNPADYSGPRLFGAYIYYDKSYFMSDRVIFGIINAEGSYKSTPRDDDSSMNWFAGSTYGNLQLLSKITNKWYYMVTLTANDVALSDNLCNNGLVHKISGVLMKPENARKN